MGFVFHQKISSICIGIENEMHIILGTRNRNMCLLKAISNRISFLSIFKESFRRHLSIGRSYQV